MSAPPPPDARSAPGPELAGDRVPAPEGAPAAVRVAVCALTDVGRTREHNEDAYLVADLAEPAPLDFAADRGRARIIERAHAAHGPGLLFIVADGLGGAAAGEVASRMAVRAVFDALRALVSDVGTDPMRFATALRDAAQAANANIHQVANRDVALRGMGTTLTAAALLGDALYLAQVGDSRAYLVRDGVARQITKDQSLMQKLLEAGEITPEQAETSARRNIILQALGPEPSVRVDITRQTVRRGDLLLLCSDGLSGQVRAGEMADAAREAPDLAALCCALVDRANATGGPDNITVVAARFDGSALADAEHADEVGHRAFPIGTPTPEASFPALSSLPAGLQTTPPNGTPLGALPPVAAAVPPATPAPADDLARRRDRARLVYAVLAVLACVLAALWLWERLGR